MAKGKTAHEAFEDGDGDKPKTIKDHKRGSAANDHQVPIDGKPGIGDNSFEPSGQTIDELLALMEQTDDEVEKLQEKMRNKTAPEREKIAEKREELAEAKKRLVGDNYSAAVLDVLMGERRDQRKAEKRKEQLDPENQKRLKAYKEAWKDFRDTDLGRAAEQRETADAVH